jgi:hypothetical protein
VLNTAAVYAPERLSGVAVMTSRPQAASEIALIAAPQRSSRKTDFK